MLNLVNGPTPSSADGDIRIMASPRTIAAPESVLLTVRALDDLYDWLESNDPELFWQLRQLRQIREDEDLPGKGKDLSELLDQWPGES